MVKQEREFAKKAMNAYQKLDSFKARQTVTSGQIYVKAQVCFKKPSKVSLEYQRYQDPMLDLEEEVTGGPEFVTQDLIAMRIIFNGKNTWFYHRESDLAVERWGRVLPSPLGQIEVMAQIGFLTNLISDYLLRGEGQGTVNNREVIKLGIKPKARSRSLFLKEEIFDFDRASLALDAETWFPLKITSYSSYRNGQITVEYQDVELNEIQNEAFDFEPSEGTKVFQEKIFKFEELGDQLPFEVDTSKLDSHNEYQLASENISVIMNKEGDRAYTTLNFYHAPNREEKNKFGLNLPHGYQLKIGNYLSKNMNRRKQFLSEKGEEVSLEGIKVTLTNRGQMVKDRLPHIDQLEIYEIGWEKEGVFYFLLGQGIKQDELVSIAQNIAG